MCHRCDSSVVESSVGTVASNDYVIWYLSQLLVLLNLQQGLDAVRIWRAIEETKMDILINVEDV